MIRRYDLITMTSTDAPIVAQFNPLYRPYLVITIGLTIGVTIIGIPLAIIWFCGVGQWWAGHYFHRLLCVLDGKTLRFRKGILFQVEKTIPLENIQDVTFIEGPILKKFHLATLKFETAGHRVVGRLILKDDIETLRAQLSAWIADRKVDAIVCSGGRDVVCSIGGQTWAT